MEEDKKGENHSILDVYWPLKWTFWFPDLLKNHISVISKCNLDILQPSYFKVSLGVQYCQAICWTLVHYFVIFKIHVYILLYIHVYIDLVHFIENALNVIAMIIRYLFMIASFKQLAQCGSRNSPRFKTCLIRVLSLSLSLCLINNIEWFVFDMIYTCTPLCIKFSWALQTTQLPLYFCLSVTYHVICNYQLKTL